MPETHEALVDVTVDVVAAYVSKQSLPLAELPGLLRSVHGAFAALDGSAAAEPGVEKPSPAAIRKSIRPDALVSFIDGRPYKTMRRHLTKHGLTPERYRERYGLPEDYPMTSAAYSAARSDLAKAIGLGVPGGRAEQRQAAE